MLIATKFDVWLRIRPKKSKEPDQQLEADLRLSALGEALSSVGTEGEESSQRPEDDASEGGLLNQLFIVMFFLYPFLCTHVFHLLPMSCLTLETDDGREQWHQYDLSINCDDPEYKTYVIMAAVAVVVYPIGVPGGVSSKS